jgi:hypothetical protein
MRHIFYSFAFFVFAFASCNNATNTTNNARSDSTVVDTTRSMQTHEYAAVIFGKYCGHCLGNCTDMFRMNITDITTVLAADTTDNYLRKGKFQFDWYLTENYNKLANALVENIPAQLHAVSDTLKRYGCPDCADQCGYYLETIDASHRSRKFQFDTDTAQVPRELRSFVVLLGNTVNQLKQ